MTLQERINVLIPLGKYMQNNGHDWQSVKVLANLANPWFVPEFIEMASENIYNQFLQLQKLHDWITHYEVPEENKNEVTVGLVMAGNIPMVGFHEEPQCASVCPVDCCVPDEMYVETVEELLEKKEKMHL